MSISPYFWPSDTHKVTKGLIRDLTNARFTSVLTARHARSDERFARRAQAFQATSFQNEHFVRGFRNFSSDKLPKRAFRARPPQLFQRQAFKTSISCEASATFQATSFQNEHFVRGLPKFSSNKLSKRAFRASLLQFFERQASKRNISCEASPIL